MKKNPGKISLIFVLTCLVIGGIFYVDSIKNPVSRVLPPPAMNSDLVGSYNYIDDFRVSITFGYEGENNFQFVDVANRTEEFGTYEKVDEGVYSLEGVLIEKQEIKVMEDVSFKININGKNMIFEKVSQIPIWNE